MSKNNPEVTIFIRYKNGYNLDYSPNAIWKGIQCVIEKCTMFKYLSLRQGCIDKDMHFIKEVQLITPKY